MPILNIRGNQIDVDIYQEVEGYAWSHPRWSSDKLIACSPFRSDSTPSFFLNLETGGWGDSGAYDLEFEKGNFVKLLSFLRDEPTEDVEGYLLTTYGNFNYDDDMHLNLRGLSITRPPTVLPESMIPRLTERGEDYLNKRGVHAKVVELMGVGFDEGSSAIVIPWRDTAGRLANVKYRQVFGKTFFYAKGGRSLRSLVWGADVVYKRGIKRAVLCEAEFDAMTWQSAGVAALAVGGVTFTQQQADIIKRSTLDTVILGGDNDKAGAKLNAEAARLLAGHVRLMVPDWTGVEAKDANEAGVDVLQALPLREYSPFETLFDT